MKAQEDGRLNGPDDVIEVVLEAAAISYWRMAAFEARGIDPDALELRVKPEAYPNEFDVETR